MITKTHLIQIVFLLSGISCLVASFGLYYAYNNSAFLFFAPFSAVGFTVNSLLTKYLSVSRQRAQQLERHVLEVTNHLNKQAVLNTSILKREEQFRGAFESASVGTLLVSTLGRIQEVNVAVCEMLGFDSAELCEKQFAELVDKEDRVEFLQSISRLAEKGNGNSRLEFRMTNKVGEIIWVGWSSSLIPEIESSASRFIFHLHDITDRKRAEERLVHDALHDALTGLPNRALFMDRIKSAFKRSVRHLDSHFALIYIDIDRFKLINDCFGHLTGDELLRQISRRLHDSLRESDTVARLGGDEFALILEDAADHEVVDHFLERLAVQLGQEITIDDRTFFATVSMGIAFWNRDYSGYKELIRDADTALYKAKRDGRNRHVVFEPSMHEDLSAILELESDLRRALLNNEFRVFYQPILELSGGKLSGFEALIRWEHPIRGLVSPMSFIPLAEESGLIVDIGAWVLEEACRQTATWNLSRQPDDQLWISVNASSRQFQHPLFVETVRSTLSRTALSASLLKLEITESMMVEDIDRIVTTMTEINQLGVRLSIDDFGTGYSSLNNLHRLPLNSLKIDRSFVNAIDQGPESEEIIRTIIALAKSLNLEIIAEGIETAEQAEYLELQNCGFGQGYLFGRPINASEVNTTLLNEKSISPATISI